MVYAEFDMLIRSRVSIREDQESLGDRSSDSHFDAEIVESEEQGSHSTYRNAVFACEAEAHPMVTASLPPTVWHSPTPFGSVTFPHLEM